MNDNIIISYLIALLNHYKLSSQSALADILGNVSHDRLTRLLHKDFSVQKLLYALISLCSILKNGYLIVDGTWLPKAYCNSLPFVKKQYCGRYGVPLIGISIVVVIWTDGFWRIPLGLKIWSKGGKSKPDLALELLSEIRNKLKIKPKFVLFDCEYSKGTLLKRLDDYGWAYVCGLSSLKYFQGDKVKNYKNKTNWYSKGLLWYGKKCIVVRNCGRFIASNRLTFTPNELKSVYAVRFTIEEFFKVLKQECGVACHVQSITAYTNHLYFSLMDFIVLEDLRISVSDTENITTIYKLRKSIVSDPDIVSTSLLKRFSDLCVI